MIEIYYGGNSRRSGVNILLAILAFMAVLVSPASLLSAEKHLTLSELAVQSDLIARVRVISMETRLMRASAGEFPFIIYKAEVIEMIHGQKSSELFFRVPGVITGNTVAIGSDQPLFKDGSDLVVFLRRADASEGEGPMYDLVSPGQGAIPVLAVPSSKKADAAVREMVPIKLGVPSGPDNASRVMIGLEDLAAHVTAAKANQAAREAGQ